MSATKALTRSRKRRAEAERPSRPGNRSLWFVTAERVREGNSSEGDDVASIPGRSRDISETYTRCEYNSSGADQSCQKFLKRGGASSVWRTACWMLRWHKPTAGRNCPDNGGRRHQRQMRFCHDYSGLSRATVPNKLNLETLRDAKSADSTGAPAILTGTGNTKRNTEVADISQMRSWVESRRTVARDFFAACRRADRVPAIKSRQCLTTRQRVPARVDPSCTYRICLPPEWIFARVGICSASRHPTR